jgi:hypothetical protein
MSGANANWWMDASCRWHQGAPPPGWWQAPNGRWHPPSHDDPTDELTADAPAGGAHLARSGRGANLWQTYRSWPLWARLAGPAVAFLLVVGVLGAAATGSLGDDGRETTATARATTTTPAETQPEAPATVPKVVTPPSSAHGTTTSAVPRGMAPPEPAPTPTTDAQPPRPTTTAAPTTTNDIHPGAPCSPEGAEAVTGDGMSVVCSTQKCHGAPFADPRWRRASC